jgi:tungstate transport system permease protein
MDIYWESISTAVYLIATLDPKLIEIFFLSFKVTLIALLISSIIGLPLGTFLAIHKFHGRSLILGIINSLMALPPVVVGLFVYINLSRSGPLGWMGILYTPTAMIIAQVILILPIISGLTAQIIEDLHESYSDLFLSLVTSKYHSIIAYIVDARYSLTTVVLAGLAKGISEVGAVIIVGGNIDYLTRVMTTTITMETSKGELSIALAIGIILLFISVTINLLVTYKKYTYRNRYYDN